MWLFSKSGFFSAVQNMNDSNLIHVRANFKGDLERLCETYGIEPNVKRIPGSDYTYRMDFTRDQWDKILVGESRKIDYVKFKPAVHDGTKRDQAYLDVFFTMQKYQD